ncbi:MAG: TonB-dependent receptor [Acidobacteriota bacterium]
MRPLKAWLGSLPALFLAAGVGSGQTTTATVTGRVLDEQRFSLSGVTVNVESPNLQGIASTITSANGDYLVGLLPPGVYTLTFQLSGFERQRKVVSLAPTQTLPLNIVMGLAKLAEDVVVVANSVNVLTQTPQVATIFKQDTIATLPTNRDISVPLLIAPGVHPSGPAGNYSIMGAMSFESRYMVNGATINENQRGQPNNLYIEDAIQETTVATDGISAEYGLFSGGVVNVVTKSGGNLFSGSFRDTLNNDNWRAYVIGNQAHPWVGDCSTCGAGGGPSKIDMVVPQYEYTLGGPIMKDHFWFFTAGRFQNQSFAKSTIAPLNLPYVAENRRKRYEVKLTGSMNTRHRFEGAYIKEALTQVNDGQSTAMDLASLITRQTPQDLVSISYDGRLSPSVSIEGRMSVRHFTFINSGSMFTDRIDGTLMLSANPAGRFWSPTFCGVCGTEKRDNNNEYVKLTLFKPTKHFGSHQMVAGYDTFDDKRFANNHQSGSDYRIQATSTAPKGGVIYAQMLTTSGTNTVTWIRFNPLGTGNLGAAFRTHGVFYSDNWHLSPRVTATLGLRYDRNHGEDSAGRLVANDNAISPRLAVVWDPVGDGRWSLSGSASRYVAALSSSIGDISSGAGNPATLQWLYQGPPINPDLGLPASALVPTDQVIKQVFDWCHTDARGFCQNGTLQALAVPGVSIRIPGTLRSPNVIAYAAGISRQFASRAVVRADYSYRDYRDFYSLRIDTSTGTVTDEFGNPADLGIVENTNKLKRRYSGLTLTATYRIGEMNLGGNYTLSRLWGNFDGENASSGPLTTDVFQYPEYRQMSWYAPEGDLSADQRHRSTVWLTFDVPRVTGLTLSLLQDLASGLPYGAVGIAGGGGGVDAAKAGAVVNPGYATPQGGSSEIYYYTARDAFHTENSKRTDVAVNYGYSVGRGSRKVDLFFQAQMLNLFNTFDLCGCGSTVFSNGGAMALNTIGQTVTALREFNPFTTTPVEGTNWKKGTNFGTPLNRSAFTSPRTVRLSFGVRF